MQKWLTRTEIYHSYIEANQEELRLCENTQH